MIALRPSKRGTAEAERKENVVCVSRYEARRLKEERQYTTHTLTLTSADPVMALAKAWGITQ